MEFERGSGLGEALKADKFFKLMEEEKFTFFDFPEGIVKSRPLSPLELRNKIESLNYSPPFHPAPKMENMPFRLRDKFANMDADKRQKMLSKFSKFISFYYEIINDLDGVDIGIDTHKTKENILKFQHLAKKHRFRNPAMYISSTDDEEDNVKETAQRKTKRSSEEECECCLPPILRTSKISPEEDKIKSKSYDDWRPWLYKDVITITSATEEQDDNPNNKSMVKNVDAEKPGIKSNKKDGENVKCGQNCYNTMKILKRKYTESYAELGEDGKKIDRGLSYDLPPKRMKKSQVSTSKAPKYYKKKNKSKEIVKHWTLAELEEKFTDIRGLDKDNTYVDTLKEENKLLTKDIRKQYKEINEMNEYISELEKLLSKE